MSAAMSSSPAAAAKDNSSRAIHVFLVCLPVLMAICMLPAAESPFSIPKRALLIAASFGVFLIAAAFGRLRRIDWALAAAMAAVPASVLLAWAASPRRDLGAQSVLMVCAGPLLAWVVASLPRDSRPSLLAAVAWSGVLEAMIAIAQWGLHFDVFTLIGRSSGASGRMQLYGTMGNPDFLAIYIAITLPALLTVARRSATWTRWLAWGGVALDLAALAGAGSRTGMVAATCGCLMALLCGRGRARLRLMVVVVAIAAIVATTLAWRNPREASTAMRGRMFTWQVSLGDAAHRPLGDGPGTFAYLYPTKLSDFVRAKSNGDWAKFIGYERTANNDFVQALAETGWPGLLGLLAVFGMAFIRLLRGAREGDTWSAAAFGVVGAIFAASLAESPVQRAETWALVWACVGMATSDSTEAQVHAREGFGGLRFAIAAALAVLVVWIAAKPVLATYWSDAGAGLESEKRYTEAAVAYRKSIGYDPSASSAAFNLPRALAHAGDLDAAITAANDGLRWIDEPELHLLRLRILETRGDYPAAFQAAVTDVKRFPYSPELRDEFLQIASHLHSF